MLTRVYLDRILINSVITINLSASGGRQILSHNHASFSIYSESEATRYNWYSILFKVIHAVSAIN